MINMFISFQLFFAICVFAMFSVLSRFPPCVHRSKSHVTSRCTVHVSKPFHPDVHDDGDGLHNLRHWTTLLQCYGVAYCCTELQLLLVTHGGWTTVLYGTAPYCAVLFHAVLHFAVLYCSVTYSSFSRPPLEARRGLHVLPHERWILSTFCLARFGSFREANTLSMALLYYHTRCPDYQGQLLQIAMCYSGRTKEPIFVSHSSRRRHHA